MYTLCERKLSPMLIKFPPKGGQILISETPVQATLSGLHSIHVASTSDFSA